MLEFVFSVYFIKPEHEDVCHKNQMDRGYLFEYLWEFCHNCVNSNINTLLIGFIFSINPLLAFPSCYVSYGIDLRELNTTWNTFTNMVYTYMIQPTVYCLTLVYLIISSSVNQQHKLMSRLLLQTGSLTSSIFLNVDAKKQNKHV